MILTLTLSGCAGAKLARDLSDVRGYPEADVAAIKAKAQEYNRRLAWANTASNAFDSSPIQSEQAKLRNVFCACAKKMGEKCRTAEGAGVDRDLWIKANAVDLAFGMQSAGITSQITFSEVDPHECQ